MNESVIFMFAAILIVGGLLFAVVTLTRRGGKQLDVTKFRRRWLSIEQQLKESEPSSYQLAVLNADKLLDLALREKGVAGETMGARMKQTTFSNANATWSAHKLRNQIAHETDVAINYQTARRALASFKQALKDVGAI